MPKKVRYRTKALLKKKEGNQINLLIMVNFHAPGSGSALPIRTRIAKSMLIHADPDPQHCFSEQCFDIGERGLMEASVDTSSFSIFTASLAQF
jgi:hypothetical protein